MSPGPLSLYIYSRRDPVLAKLPQKIPDTKEKFNTKSKTREIDSELVSKDPPKLHQGNGNGDVEEERRRGRAEFTAGLSVSPDR